LENPRTIRTIGSLDDYLSHYLALFDQLRLSQLPHAKLRMVDNAGHLLLDESAEARREVEIFLR